MSEATETAPRPAIVPNVRPNARSGIDHTPIGANAQEAYDANAALDAGDPTDPNGNPSDPNGDPTDPQDEPTIPADVENVDDLLAWVEAGDDTDAQRARAEVVHDAEHEAVEAGEREVPRKTLIDGLAPYLDATSTTA